MPREFLPKNRRREPNAKAELFPRTSARVMAGPPSDRAMYPEETGNRTQAKRALREVVERGERGAW
jgi:hypothetical protein